MKNKDKIILFSLAFFFLLIPACILLKFNPDVAMDIKPTEITLPDGYSDIQSARIRLSYIDTDSSMNEDALIEQEQRDTLGTKNSVTLRSSEDLKKIILSIKGY